MTDNLSKARLAKVNKARDSIWSDVSEHRKATGCTCDFDRDSTLADLTADVDCCGVRYICPTLDKYRRLLGAPIAHADETNAPANFYPPKVSVIL